MRYWRTGWAGEGGHVFLSCISCGLRLIRCSRLQRAHQAIVADAGSGPVRQRMFPNVPTDAIVLWTMVFSGQRICQADTISPLQE